MTPEVKWGMAPTMSTKQRKKVCLLIHAVGYRLISFSCIWVFSDLLESFDFKVLSPQPKIRQHFTIWMETNWTSLLLAAGAGCNYVKPKQCTEWISTFLWIMTPRPSSSLHYHSLCHAPHYDHWVSSRQGYCYLYIKVSSSFEPTSYIILIKLFFQITSKSPTISKFSDNARVIESYWYSKYLDVRFKGLRPPTVNN